MSVQVRRRRESAAFLANFVGAQGELIVDTTNNRVQVHDGATPGGWPAARLADLPSSASPLALTQGGTGVAVASPAALATALGLTARTTVNDAAYAAQVGDRLIAFTALSAARTVTLPPAAAFPTGVSLTIVDESGACSSNSAIVVAAAGTDKVNGGANVSVTTAYGYLALESSGAGKWTVIDSVVAGGSGATAAITGGTINGATIGATTPAAGAFTTLSASGAVNLPANSLPLATQPQAPAATLRGNPTGATANVQDATLSAHLDAAVGSTQGTVLYRGSGGWAALAAGSSGQVLTSAGPSANPAWQTPAAVSATVPRSYLAGLTLSNDATTPNTVLDIAVGVAASDDSSVLMSLTSAITKSIASTFATGSANGGLDTGTIAASTWYHVYLIANAAATSVDVLLSASATSPTLPSGFTKKRRIGSIRTDASSHVLAFSQNGDEFLWSTSAGPFGDVQTASIGTTPVLATLTVPQGLEVIAKTRALYQSSSGLRALLLSSPDESAVATGTPSGNFSILANATSSYAAGAIDIRTNASGQIRAVASGNGDNYSIATYGFVDTRGRFT